MNNAQCSCIDASVVAVSQIMSFVKLRKRYPEDLFAL